MAVLSKVWRILATSAMLMDKKPGLPTYHVAGRLCVQSYPLSGGTFHSHQMAVQQSMKRHLEARGYTISPYPEDSVPLLVLYQSQGRLGDELPAGLPREVYQGSRKIILGVIQDDEFNRADRSCLPPGLNPILIMNIHVVPGQDQLHWGGQCRNDGEIQRLVELVPPNERKSRKSLVPRVVIGLGLGALVLWGFIRYFRGL